MPILREYLNENAHRYYPFVNANEVPTGLILDCCLLTTPNVHNNATKDDAEVTYISQLVSDDTSLRIYLKSGTYDFGCIAVSDVSQPLLFGGVVGRRSDIKYAKDGYIIQGYIVTGDLEYLLPRIPPSITLEASEGLLYTNCIMHMSQWLTGIQVGEETLTGLVNLVAGKGINLTVDQTNNTITVSCTGAEIPPDNRIIRDDITLLSAITAMYGHPITSINGVPITAGGNWTIAVLENEGLVVKADAANCAITINNPSATACCSDTNISTLAANIATLNERVGTIQSFQNQLETNMNVLSTQLTRLV